MKEKLKSTLCYGRKRRVIDKKIYFDLKKVIKNSFDDGSYIFL